MKKKLCVLIFVSLLCFLFTSCDEVLSVVTVNKSGEKVVNNYVSLFSNDFYEKNVSLRTWRKASVFDEEPLADFADRKDLLFKIENKKENVVVLGDEEGAIEIVFFDGGYKCTIYTSM